ncbi:MAG: SusC/RagA family TonB-linked outer membrane protein [Candidatus Pedobacter colombiensis]|uniref:SusC/RagA family TonB-linked outer membrane protein n=1 Tax=Candidatus Pedobacter colombiensis TaxID=3121371 RepID=A0AAJ5W9L3_9SPHI|nr:SusC/RagA family TonB-linked outer membrane protein [Pedobacter sp.]WEK19813.1 MAG: SusC/RagA family TonB-linked outer membrane protein [Pedobacter sp.]
MIRNSTNYMQFKRPFKYLAFAWIVVFIQLPQLLQAETGSVAYLFRQEIVTVKGTVKDGVDKQPLPGVTITDSQRKVLGVTDQNGFFTIKVAKGAEISFNMLGFTAVKHTINASQDNLSIMMSSSSNDLNEVVVTALGIKREEKSLGYSTTTVKGEDLTNALSNNWTDALSGKVAGLNIIKSGGGPAGSTKIILRGENSFNAADSEALIVVDGVIISGGSGKLTGTGSGNYLDADSPVDFGSSIADINPDDIESVSVLKGPGASALYGSRGGNGAILITTKQGSSKQKGWGITLNSNTSFATINRWPDYQYEYGQGDRATNGDLYYSYGDSEDGGRTYSSSSAWGPKFNGQLYYQYEPDRYRLTAIPAGTATKTPWVAYPNNRKDFFETAKTFTNSLSLAGGTAKTSVRLSYTNAVNTWIIPNTGYNRNTVALQLSHAVNDKLTVSSKINYNNRWSDNLPSTGYNNQTIMYFIRGLTPNMDLNWFKDYWLPGQEGITQRRPFSLQLDNPYLQANEMLNKSNRNGIIGNVSATYNFNKKLSLLVRSALDFSAEDRSQRKPKNTQKYADGMYREQDIVISEVNSDFLLKYDDAIKSANLKYSMSVGGSMMHNRYRRDEYRAEKLIYPGIFTLANSALTLEARPVRSQYATNSWYGLGTISYRDYLFLDATVRSDRTSILTNPMFPARNKPIFYSSLNLSAVMSEIFKLPSEISFWKMRASIAGVGSGSTTPYMTSYTYSPSIYFPSGLVNPTTLPNMDLRPLFTKSLELGTNIRLFKSSVELDVAVYKNNTSDQIIPAPVDVSSGYSQMYINAGEVQNKGLEIQLNGTPLKSKNGLNWKSFGNISSNTNKVISIMNDRKVLLTMFGANGSIEARTGGSLGDMFGFGYVHAPDGQIVYENGLAKLGDTLLYLGNYVPKYKFGFGNQFSYKRFGLNILFDGQIGGKAYSLTHAVLAEEGKLKETLPGRYNGIIGNGVIKNADGTYRPNDVVATNIGNYYYSHFQRENIESNIFRTDYIKLREVRFDYTLSPRLIKRLKMQKATIGVYGRDLLVFTKWPAFDPEFGTLADGEITSGAEIAQFPSTRTIGINLSISL